MFLVPFWFFSAVSQDFNLVSTLRPFHWHFLLVGSSYPDLCMDWILPPHVASVRSLWTPQSERNIPPYYTFW